MGNVVNATWFFMVNGFSNENRATFMSQLANGWLQYFFSGATLVVSLLLIKKGLRRGIEAASRWMVPFFMIVALVLIADALTLEGATEKMIVFLKPDFDAINSSVLFAALGQAFFSLGLGGTFLLMYGSYLDDKQSILS